MRRSGLWWLGAAGAAMACGCAGRSAATTEPLRGVPLGSLVGREVRLVILATPRGTRYDAWSHDGAVLARGLTADQVARQFPGQDPRGAIAPQALMLAWPQREGLGID